MKRLDLLLSEELRQGSSSDLIRSRVTVGSTCFQFLFSLVALVSLPRSASSIVVALLSLGLGAVLVLARRASSYRTPALLLCTVTALACIALPFLLVEKLAFVATHAGLMYPIMISVYLLGARTGFFITLLMAVSLGGLYPLYFTHFGPGARVAPGEFFWPLYVFILFSYLGAWVIGSLHSAARTEVQNSLERTLGVLRESEGKLSSVIESTDDLVVSIDTAGRLITANAAAKQAYLLAFGREATAGQPYFTEAEPEMLAAWMPRLGRALAGQRQRYEEEYTLGGVRFTFEISVNPIHGAGGRITGVTIFSRDITARKEAELRLGEMHRALVDVSRQAGMAEIATGVLHNVGNTLNGVNVSTTLVVDQLRKSRLPGLPKALGLLREHSSDLASFLTGDPRGQRVLTYLSALSDQLHVEHEVLLKEMRALCDSVDHIKSIVSMQQKYARVSGAVEEVSVPQIIDEALRLHAGSFERLGIQLERDYADVPPILVDRHRLLQILVNLVINAKDALVASEKRDKRLRIGVHLLPEGKGLLLQVTDNGMGIAPEDLGRMFTQGFTTKKDGHGFGLHISALSAMEMKGRLTCTSPGPGHGATFTLELPLEGTGTAG